MMKFYLCCNLYNLYEFKAFNLEMQVLYNIHYICQFFITIAFILIFIYMNLHIYM